MAYTIKFYEKAIADIEIHISESMKKKIDRAMEDERTGRVMRFASFDKLKKTPQYIVEL